MNLYEKIYKDKGFSLSQIKILEIIGENKKVLEVGASFGYMTKALIKAGCLVDVVEVDQIALKSLKKIGINVYNFSIEEESTKILRNKNYDFIILADVLEHLVSPEKGLKNLKKIGNNNTIFLISVPNIASWPIRKQLFFKGDFEYTDTGILDRTHLHFYTFETLPKFLKKEGFQVSEVIGTISSLPFDTKLTRIPVFGLFYKSYLRPKLVNKFKNLSFNHFVVVASK